MKRERADVFPSKVLRGFWNTGTDCFINAPLLAMLGPYAAYLEDTIPNKNRLAVDLFKQGMDSHHSNFYYALIVKEYPSSPNPHLVCNQNEEEDFGMVQIIQAYLKDLYMSLVEGKAKLTCKDFRQFFESCQTLSQMRRGQHDAQEFYNKILDIFNYSPMMTYDVVHYFTGNRYDNYVCSKTPLILRDTNMTNGIKLSTFNQRRMLRNRNKVTIPNAIMTPLYKMDQPRIPGDCNGVFINHIFNPLLPDQIPTVFYEQDVTYFMNCDIFVVSVDRILGERTEIEVPFEINLTSRKLENVEDVEMMRSFDGDTKLDTFMEFQKQKYCLLSAVLKYSKDADEGHFVTLLCVPQSNPGDDGRNLNLVWMYYDDLKPNPQVVDYPKAIDLISKYGILLFYFPFGSPRDV